MRIYKTVTKATKEQIDITCDKCGRSCIGECTNFCGIHFTVSGGYDSPVFPDDPIVRQYDVCEYCAHEWLKAWPKDYLVMTATLEK